MTFKGTAGGGHRRNASDPVGLRQASNSIQVGGGGLGLNRNSSFFSSQGSMAFDSRLHQESISQVTH
jgi:hypothetical protein